MTTRNSKEPFNLLQRWQSGKITRKEFLTSLAILTAGASIPIAFKTFWQKNQRDAAIFNTAEWEMIGVVQEHLLPSEENAPGAREINARSYLQWVMKDPNYDADEKQYIRSGLRWLEETAIETSSTAFLELSFSLQENLLRDISTESWGESWLSKILSFIFEALFCDPIYGGNPESIGWNWLSHYPGLPRPNSENRYGSI